MFSRLVLKAVLVLPLALLASCDNDEDLITILGYDCLSPAPTHLPATAVGLTTANQLVTFNPGNLAAASTTVAVTGLGAGEQLVGIDFRPADGILVALGKTGTAGRIFTINTATGAAVALVGPALTLNGTHYGIDFNPAANRLRIVSDAEENYRVDLTVSPYTVTTDTPLTPAGNVFAAAYTNNFHNAAATTLYVLELNRGLFLQGDVDGTPSSPNLGELTVVGDMGTGSTLSGEGGMDIDGVTGTAVAAFHRIGAPSSQIFSIDLGTGNCGCWGTIPGGAVIRDLALPVPQPALAFGVDTSNLLVSFVPNAAGVGTVTTIGAISGLAAGDSIVGIDFRPANGTLYGLGSQSRLYTIDTTTAVATQVGGVFSTLLSGTAFGFDFNPVPDRIRVVSDADQNLRLNPDDGTVAGVDTPITPAGDIVAAAYTSNFAGATSTTLFGIDTTSNLLVRIGSIGGSPESPNTGAVQPVGGLEVDPSSTNAGFDIVGGAGVSATNAPTGAALAYAALTVGGVPNLYRVALGGGGGEVMQIGAGPIGGGAPVTLRALAVRVRR